MHLLNRKSELQQIFFAHITSLLLLTSIRVMAIVCLYTEFYPDTIEDKLWFIAMGKGIRLDNAAVGWMSFVSVILLMFSNGKYRKNILSALRWWYTIIPFIFLSVSVSGIPYFSEFGTEISFSSLKWLLSGSEVLAMLFSKSYLIYILAILLAFTIYAFLMRWLFPFKTPTLPAKKNAHRIIALLICAICIYGRIGRHAIDCRNAFFSDDPTMNHCAQSPSLYFVYSLFSDKISGESLCDEKTLAEHMDKYHNGKSADSHYTKHVKANPDAMMAGKKPNVVLVFMESMSSYYIDNFRHANCTRDNEICHKPLTPYIDSLYENSLRFSNCYSVGYRTSQGVAGTLCSLPSYLTINTTMTYGDNHFGGIAEVLRTNGYDTSFFMSHDPSYDNLDTFLKRNGINECHSLEEYPEDKIVNMWGVADDFLYDYALNTITAKTKKTHKPFFACIQTISNHEPYVIPESFKPTCTDNLEHQIVQYADMALHAFMDKARLTDWFDNTIFLFVGDHGRRIGAPECEMTDKINHVPFIICGNGIAPKEYSNPISQTDIQATLLSDILGIEYDQTAESFGGISSPRQFVCYSGAGYLACRSINKLFIYRYDDGNKYYYEGQGINVKKTNADEELKEMETYCLAEYELLNRRRFSNQNKN